MHTKIYKYTDNDYKHVNVYTVKAFLDNGKILAYNSYNTFYLFNVDDPDIIMMEVWND